MTRHHCTGLLSRPFFYDIPQLSRADRHALCLDDNAVALARLLSTQDPSAGTIDIQFDFRDQNIVRSTGKPRVKSDISTMTSHNFYDTGSFVSR